MLNIKNPEKPMFKRKPHFERRTPERVKPSLEMIESICCDGLKYEDLTIDKICDLFMELLVSITNITHESLHRNLLQFYSLICHPNMQSLMIPRKHVNNRISIIENLLNETYQDVNFMNFLGNVFVKELYLIGLIQLSREHKEIALSKINEEELNDIIHNCSVINETSTLSTKFIPVSNTYPKIVLNINGGHGQGEIIPSMLSNVKFFKFIFDDIVNNDGVFVFNIHDNVEIYSIEQIEDECEFIVKLFHVASFGFVRKLLEIIFGYKAFEYFSTKTELRGLPFDSKGIPYTKDTLQSIIKLKMIDELMNPKNHITIKLWKHSMDVSRLLYSDF